MIDLLFGSTIKKIIAGAIAVGLLIGIIQIRSCLKAKEQLRQYEQAEKIRQQDKKIDQKTEGEKNEIEKFNTPDDFRNMFDRLRNR